MSRADSFEGALTGYGAGWHVPSVDCDAARVRESGWNLLDPFYPGGIASISSPTVITLTGSAISAGATGTAGPSAAVATAGSNFTVATAGYGPPAPEPLAVRRFYHWNKRVTAGAAGRLSGPQDEDVADTVPIADVIATDGRETEKVTKLGHLQVTLEDTETGEEREYDLRRGRLVRRKVPSPRSLTSVAVVLAGQKRSMVSVEWQGHLLGGLSQRQQTRAARGFLWAAVRLRLQDAAASAWRPADAVLGSRTLSNLFVWGPVAAMLVAIYRHDGRFGLVADIQDPVALGVFLYGVIRTGRWWRVVKPPEPKARRAKE